MPGPLSHRFLLPLLLALTIERSAAQTPSFNWTDSVVHIGQERRMDVRSHWNSGARLDEGSYPILDSLVAFMTSWEGVLVEIGRHTDSRGSEAYNLKLSQVLTQAVRNYMVSEGIDPTRVVPKGYGETQPIIPEGSVNAMPTEEERKAAHTINRRTIVRIIALQPHCELERLRLTAERLPELDEREIFYFLRTIHPSCGHAAEFVQWANELLHKCLRAHPLTFLDAMADPHLGKEQRDFIIGMLSNPIHDMVDLSTPREWAGTEAHPELRERLAAALEEARARRSPGDR